MSADPWTSLETEAQWQLEHADQLPPREILHGMALQLRLWRYRRSGVRVSWSVLLPVLGLRNRRGIVREVAWDRVQDWKARTSPLAALKRRPALSPSVQKRDAELSREELAPYLDVIGGLRSPMPAPASEGPAGDDAYGLEGYRSFAHIRLAWKGRGPRGWGDTVAWVARLRELLIRSMRERESEGP